MSAEPANIPSLLAILVCDQIIIEQGNGKKTLVGIFEDLWSQAEPIAQRVGLFARMTDLEGLYAFAIKVVRVAAEEELVVAAGNVQMDKPITDRLALLDLALNLPVGFPKFGMYEFQLFANDIYIGRAVVHLRQQGVVNQ